MLATVARRAGCGARRLPLLPKNLVNRDDWERREGDLPGTLDAASAPEIGERFQRPDSFDYGLRYPSRGLRTAFGNVVADPFKVGRGFRRPADAHQPR